MEQPHKRFSLNRQQERITKKQKGM